jgi:hypothetical protein
MAEYNLNHLIHIITHTETEVLYNVEFFKVQYLVFFFPLIVNYLPQPSIPNS